MQMDRPELARSSFPHARTRDTPRPRAPAARARAMHLFRLLCEPVGGALMDPCGRVDWLINYLGEPDRVGNGRWCVCRDDDDDNPSWWFIRS